MINISMKLNNFFEKIEKMDMGDVIKDFQKSDAPQFKGKSKKKRRQMAIAAKLNAEESIQNEAVSTNMQNMFDELRIDDNTNITDGNKQLTPAEVGSGFYLLGFDRDGSCFEMNKISKERAKDSITGYGEYKVADADITDFDGARYYYNENMPDSGVLNIKKAANEAEESVDESGCLGKQIKKGKAKKKESKINEYKYYTVKGPKGFKEKILAGSESDAKTKARHIAYRQGKASAGASRYSGTTDSDFEIQESYIREDIDLSDNMIGTPDSYYDEEERKEAFEDLKDAMDEFAKGWEQESVMQGICPNCAGTGYQDAEYPEYDDDGEEIEGSAYECDGHGMYGCDEGQMVGASWVDIIQHDERNAEREKAKADYPGDEAVIDQIARAVKMMDDPRQMYQYMKADYPFMGIAQRSALIAKGMKKAGLTEGSLDYLDKGIYANDEKREKLQMTLAMALGDTVTNPNGWYKVKIEELEQRLEQEDKNLYKKYLLFKSKLGLMPQDRPADYDVKMSPYESYVFEHLLSEEERYVIVRSDGMKMSHYSTEKEAEDTIKMLKDSGIKSEYSIQKQNFPQKSSVTEGEERSIIHDATVRHLIDEFTDRVDDMESLEELHDKMYMELEYLDVDEIVDPKMEVGGQPIGNYATGRVIDILDSGSVMDEVTNSLDLEDLKDRDPVFPMQYEGKSPHKKGTKKYKKHMAAMHAEDVDTDSNEADVSKMLAKALGDPNKWTQMTAPELYAELESLDPDMADVIKLTAKMIYDVKLDENTKDKPSRGDCEPCKGTGYKDANVKDFKSCPVCDGDGEDPGFGGTKAYEEITLDEDQDFTEEFGILGYSIDEENTFEAEYRGRKVKLNKPMRGDVKKFKVYVKDPKTGNVKKVNFGHGGTSAKRPTMRIRKSNPKARKSFRARHNCDNPGPKTKARYWSCRKW